MNNSSINSPNGSNNANSLPAFTNNPSRSDAIVDPKIKQTHDRIQDATQNTLVGMIQHDSSTNMLHSHSYGDKAKKIIEEVDDNATVIKYDYEPTAINGKLLNNEIDAIILSDPSDLPVAQKIIKAAAEKIEGTDEYKYPELQNMKTIAKNIVNENDGILLPGGSSIHPKFYGETLSPNEDVSHYDSSMKRTVLEFCLISECRTQGKSLLGICRGHQVINVYFGGKLDRQTIGDMQSAKVRNISPISNADSKYIEIPERVFFNHKQIVTKIGSELDSLVYLKAQADLVKEKKSIDQKIQEAKASLETPREEYENWGGEQIYDEALETLNAGEALKIKTENILTFLENENVVLAVENKEGAPVIGVQFHPEAIQDEDSLSRSININENRAIIENFIKSSETLKNKRALLKELKSKLPPKS